MKRSRGAAVGDRGLDLAAMAHDRRVAEQALDVGVPELRQTRRIEVGERRAERVALAQDRQPGQPGLEALEADAFEERSLVGDGLSPLVVVVGRVERVASAEA